MRRSLFGLLMSVVAVTAAAQPTLVDTVTVEKRRWQQTVPLYGTLTSPRDADLTPRLAGLVDSVAVDAGDRVEQGDLLISLDRTLAALTLRTLQASAAEAEARFDEARRLAREAERLSERGAISSTELESRLSQVEIAKATVERLDAESAGQQERLQRHAVIAPFDGVVRDRRVDPGEYVAETTPVLGLVATDVLRMDVTAPQQYYAMITPGMPVQILPEAMPEQPIEARVDVTVPAADPMARSFLVRIFVDNEDQRLTPGMSAKVMFVIESRDPVLVAPRDAIVRVPSGGTRMWVVTDDGEGATQAIKRQVTIGRGAHGLVEVRDGLDEGAQVVVRGNESLESGQAVEVRRRRGAVEDVADQTAARGGASPASDQAAADSAAARRRAASGG